MNYLDLLTDDLVEKILDNITDDINKKISILNKKINKLNKNLKHLNIYKYEEYIFIDYCYVSYCIDNYLFSKFKSDKYVVFIDVYNNYFGEEDGSTFQSVRFKRPSYFDILVQANKAITTTKDYHHRFLEGLNHIPNNKLFGYSGIKPNRNIEYYEFMLGS